MDFYQTRKPQLLKLSNILLRVPSIFILELLYNSRTPQILKEGDVLGHSPSQVISEWGFNPDNVTIGVQYVGYVVAFLLHALPISKLLELYRHILVGILLVASHYISSIFLSWEQYGRDPEDPVCEERSVPRLLVFMGVQLTISLLCGLLMRTKHIWAFAAYLLPVFMRLLNLSIDITESMHIIAETVVLMETSVFILTNILVPYKLALNGLQMMQEYVELYGIVSVIFAVYNRFFIPTVYLIFWLSMFMYHLYLYFHSKSQAVFEEKWVLLLLTTIGDCCMSPWSLIGLCFSVSYGAYTLLTFCKIYLKGFYRVNSENDFLRQGWTEGITLLLLALQTGLLQLKTHEKVLLLSIVLFIVMSSTIQSIYELTDPVLLSLGVSNNRNILMHVKVLVMCCLLFSTPLYMSHTLIWYFQVELWLMIIISSCVLTSVQTAASVMIYLLFMLDHRRKVPTESLDDIVYCIHALCHIAEFSIALFVLVYGGFEAMKGDYNLLGTSIIAMHSYFNVWQRGQRGWNNFLSRMQASKKVKSLPKADPEDLQDVCAICYEEMKSARVTPCRHFFHTICLRKWLYVQITCPMCHATIVQGQNNKEREGQETTEEQHNGNAEIHSDSDSSGSGNPDNPSLRDSDSSHWSEQEEGLNEEDVFEDAAECVCRCCGVRGCED
ncbi:hypothetical protein HOLleu_33624 [Holothuria leucospilota]|uniref:RING-type domain-containing protein n=1 Tax=Holothuria leucospilota TaxID=206669 RepID=A0A9Q0YS74_HOLLE|nr:hypothetical protein HOLleu_33624 [Holothuria leucospilota]